MHPYLDVPAPFAMAHRGFSPDGLENTMAAFQGAVALGLTHVETDVHATRDGVLVAFHDDRLDRLTGASGAISDLSWAQVRTLRIRGAEPIPLLEDLLGTWPDLRVNIDVKGWSAVGPISDVLRRTGALHRVCVASFDSRRTAAVRRACGPELATSAGRRDVARWRLASFLPRSVPFTARLARPSTRGMVAYQVPPQAGPFTVVSKASVRRAHDAGHQVHAWTVNDPTQMHALLDLGVDAIISDRSDTVLRVLRERASRRA